jgi:hypothetical protein
MEIREKYDLIVVGGGTSGVAAAVSGAREGLKVLLIEKNSFLGGTMTSALVTPMMRNLEQENTKILSEILEKLKQTSDSINYMHDNPGWFNPEIMKCVLDDICIEAGVELLLDTVVISVDTFDNKMESIECFNKSGRQYFGAKYFIDATGDADLAALAKIPFDVGDYGRTQPVSLRFNMSGVNIEKLAIWLENFDTDRNVTTVFKENGKTYLSTACTFDNNKEWKLRPLFEKGIEAGILKYCDCKYFQIFSIPGQDSAIAFNCPRIDLIINPLKASDITRALIEGRKSIRRLAKFMQKFVPGFENSYVSNIANNLGVRDSRRIKGKYCLTKDDVSRLMPNPVAKSDYPFDVHSNAQDKSILSRRAYYEIPLDSLLVNQLNNFMVVGRCISSDFLMQSSLRIQPNCFAMGEFAGKYVAQKLKDII